VIGFSWWAGAVWADAALAPINADAMERRRPGRALEKCSPAEARIREPASLAFVMVSSPGALMGCAVPTHGFFNIRRIRVSAKAVALELASREFLRSGKYQGICGFRALLRAFGPF